MKTNKLISLLLVLSLCFCFVGCNPQEDAKKDEPEEPARICLLAEDGTTDYKVIRPDSATYSLRSAVQTLCTTFKEKAQTKITQGSDWSSTKQYADREILIGSTNRPESEEILATLQDDEYAIAVIGQKLVICGGCQAATVSAVEYFIDNLLRQPFTYTEGVIYKATATPEELIYHITGEETSETTVVYEGITRTHYTTKKGSMYGLQDINVLDIDFSNTNLRFCISSYDEDNITVLNTVKNTAEKYNKTNTEGLTVLEAVNADMWMTSAHARRLGKSDKYGSYTDAVVTQSFTVPRSFNVHNGEIISSAHIRQETPYEDDFWCWGLGADGQFYLGCPQLKITVKTSESTFYADGLNRLPADNALVVYSHSVNEIPSLDDAYEIVLSCDTYTVRHGEVVAGTVVGIYGPGDESPVTVGDNQIVLTARGTAVAQLQGILVGETLTVSFSVTDKAGNDAAWQTIVWGDGGHVPPIINGVVQTSQNETRIPTTLIGLRANGHLVILTNDGYSTNASFSEGLMIKQLGDLCKELGIVTAILCDGGGSTTLVERGEDGTYSVLNHPSDGQERKVGGAVMICTTEDLK